MILDIEIFVNGGAAGNGGMLSGVAGRFWRGEAVAKITGF